jgi:precorrin-3B C17-methyltransferase
VVAGYSRYLALLPQGLLADKKLVHSGMRNEMERCAAAMDAVLSGETAALVSSGDPGIYALAGIVYELADKRKLKPEDLAIEVIPGVPALCAAAALLGAPLAHDFAVISLSDLLTAWEIIERRIEHALAADFTLVIHNPRSRGRNWQLNKLLELAIAARGKNGRIGHVRNAYRENEHISILALGDFDPGAADMLSILIVGNSETRMWGEAGQKGEQARGAKMYTPRGYLKKYSVEYGPGIF